MRFGDTGEEHENLPGRIFQPGIFITQTRHSQFPQGVSVHNKITVIGK
jgi:hypothetical protein